MAWHRYEIKPSWQMPPERRTAPHDHQGDYDFHTFYLEILDVIWAWAFAAVAVVVLLIAL